MVEDTQKRYADDVTVQELVRLRVENERLREALQFYADKDTYTEKIRPHYLGDYEAKDIHSDEGEIARSALQQNEAQILATNKYEAEGRN